MIKYKEQRCIEYKIHKLDKGIFLCIYEDNSFEVIGKYISQPIRQNKSGNRYVIEQGKVYFIEKYLDKNIKYTYETI